MLVIGSWSGIEPTLATALVLALWMLLYQRERSLCAISRRPPLARLTTPRPPTSRAPNLTPTLEPLSPLPLDPQPPYPLPLTPPFTPGTSPSTTSTSRSPSRSTPPPSLSQSPWPTSRPTRRGRPSSPSCCRYTLPLPLPLTPTLPRQAAAGTMPTACCLLPTATFHPTTHHLLQVHFREQRIEQLAQEKERLQYPNPHPNPRPRPNPHLT